MQRSELLSLVLAGLSITCATCPVSVAVGGADDKWHLTGELYVWTTEISGTTILSGDIEVDFNDIRDNLDLASLAGVAWRPRWGQIAVGYRHLEWDFRSGSPLKDPDISGPGVSCRYHFF